MTDPELLLELQLLDSAIDMIQHRMPRLPEVVASAQADADVRVWEQQSAALQKQIAAFEATIADAEQASATITKQRTRLEQQLKTVISPREAEALMHEIQLLQGKRSALDDEELEAMEAMAGAEAEQLEQFATEESVRAAASAASVLASEARALSQEELAARTAERDAKRAALDPATLSRYDSMRTQHNGIAIAKLNGLQCDGCHLDLSRGEVDNIKRMPPDELPECPNCGRLLVR